IDAGEAVGVLIAVPVAGGQGHDAGSADAACGGDVGAAAKVIPDPRRDLTCVVEGQPAVGSVLDNANVRTTLDLHPNTRVTWIASAITCAAECRIRNRASGSREPSRLLAVTAANALSLSITVDRSRSSPLTLHPRASAARRGPMDLATSSPVTGPGKDLVLPS